MASLPIFIGYRKRVRDSGHPAREEFAECRQLPDSFLSSGGPYGSLSRHAAGSRVRSKCFTNSSFFCLTHSTSLFFITMKMKWSDTAWRALRKTVWA